MIWKKGQVSIEMLVLTAIVLVIIGVFAFQLYSQQSGISGLAEGEQAQNAVSEIAKASDAVFLQGAGAVMEVQVTVPKSVDLNASGIKEKQLFLRIQNSDVIATSGVKLQGSFPQEKGFQTVPVNARAGYVFVGKAFLEISKYSISLYLKQGEEKIESIKLKNTGSAVMQITIGLENLSNDFLAVSVQDSLSLQAGEEEDLQVSFNASPLAIGSFKGAIILNAVAGSYFEKLSIPVSVEVIPSTESFGTLVFFPRTWQVSLKESESLEKTFRVCNASNTEIQNISFENSTVFSMPLPKLESASGSVWSVLADPHFVYAGLQDGSIYSWYPDFTFNKKVNASLSPVRSLSSDSEFLYAGSTDGKVYVFSKPSLELSKTLPESGTSAIKSVFADSELVFAASNDGLVLVWEKPSLTFKTRLSNSAESLNSVTADSEFVYFAGSDPKVYVWRKQGLSFFKALETGSAVNSITAGSNFVFAGLQDGSVKVFQKPSLELYTSIQKSSQPVRMLSSSEKNNSVVAAASEEGVYFLETPLLKITLSASQGTFMQSAFSFGDFSMVGTDNSKVYVINYSDYYGKGAGDWLEVQNALSSIPADSCKTLNLRVTVPPLTPSASFFGELKMQTLQADASDVLKLQVNVQ